MKKTLFFGTLLFSSFFCAQVLQEHNFEGLNVATAIGQNGYANLNGTSSDYQIINNSDLDLKIVGSATTGARYLWKDGLDADWATRSAGNEILQIEYDFYTGGPSTSKNGLGIELYNAAYDTYLGGITMAQDTKAIYGLYSPTAGANPSLVNPAAGGIILPANTWVRVGFSYNTTDGTITFKGPGFYGTVTGAVDSPFEFDFTVQNLETGNAASSDNLFDNVVVKAVAVESLLAVDDIVSSKSSILLYPNPTSDYIKVKSDSSIKGIYIYDTSGIRVITSLNTDTVDVSKLQNGIYVVRISTKDGFKSMKFIKK